MSKEFNIVFIARDYYAGNAFRYRQEAEKSFLNGKGYALLDNQAASLAFEDAERETMWGFTPPASKKGMQERIEDRKVRLMGWDFYLKKLPYLQPRRKAVESTPSPPSLSFEPSVHRHEEVIQA